MENVFLPRTCLGSVIHTHLWITRYNPVDKKPCNYLTFLLPQVIHSYPQVIPTFCLYQ